MAMKVVYTNFCGQLIHEDRGGVETEFVPDTLGSVMMCRSATGTTTYTADYWPYGEVASSTGTNPSAWGFGGTLGYYTDPAPGSLYVRARILLPNNGRWATVDPLWPGEAAYPYGACAPVTNTDASGWKAGTPIYKCTQSFPGRPTCSDLLAKIPADVQKAIDDCWKKGGSWRKYAKCVQDQVKGALDDLFWQWLACMIGAWARGTKGMEDPCKGVHIDGDDCCYGNFDACIARCSAEEGDPNARGICMESCKAKYYLCIDSFAFLIEPSTNPWPGAVKGDKKNK